MQILLWTSCFGPIGSILLFYLSLLPNFSRIRRILAWRYTFLSSMLTGFRWSMLVKVFYFATNRCLLGKKICCFDVFRWSIATSWDEGFRLLAFGLELIFLALHFPTVLAFLLVSCLIIWEMNSLTSHWLVISSKHGFSFPVHVWYFYTLPLQFVHTLCHYWASRSLAWEIHNATWLILFTWLSIWCTLRCLFCNVSIRFPSTRNPSTSSKGYQ